MHSNPGPVSGLVTKGAYPHGCLTMHPPGTKWRSSEELAVSAREGAARAPLGSLPTALPLIA